MFLLLLLFYPGSLGKLGEAKAHLSNQKRMIKNDKETDKEHRHEPKLAFHGFLCWNTRSERMKRERKYMGVMQLGGGAMGPNIRLRSKQRKNTRWEQDTRPKAQNLLLTMAGRNLEIYKQHDFRKGRSPLTLHLNQTLQICKDFSVLPPHPPPPPARCFPMLFLLLATSQYPAPLPFLKTHVFILQSKLKYLPFCSNPSQTEWVSLYNVWWGQMPETRMHVSPYSPPAITQSLTHAKDVQAAKQLWEFLFRYIPWASHVLGI